MNRVMLVERRVDGRRWLSHVGQDEVRKVGWDLSREG